MKTNFHDEMFQSILSMQALYYDTCLDFLILSNVVFVQALQKLGLKHLIHFVDIA